MVLKPHAEVKQPSPRDRRQQVEVEGFREVPPKQGAEDASSTEEKSIPNYLEILSLICEWHL